MPSLAIRSTASAVLLVFLAGLITSTLYAENSPDADRDWQSILKQATGPGNQFASKEEALQKAAQHLSTQETALRNFQSRYPEDSRSYSASIRLAAVLSAEGRLRHDQARLSEASKLLATIENGQNTPPPVRADAGFARVSQTMQDVAAHLGPGARDTLLATVRQFDTSYPADRRTGNLYTEVATLYDNLPDEKKSILEEALRRTADEAGRHRIGDDLKRIALLGREIEIRLQPVNGGAPIDLMQRRGRVVVLLFWAAYSLPALQELSALQRVAAQLEGQPVDFLTVSLDEDRAALDGTGKVADLKWPTHFDGKGWHGELVRSLGINAVPTVWVLDRQGKLVSLNARGDETDTIRRALTGP